MEAIAAAVPGAIVGAGTIRSVADARDYRTRLHLRCQPRIPSERPRCRDIGLPLLPGVATASEVMQANADGYSFLKFFPATAAGGILAAGGAARAFPVIGLLPTGGITPESAPQFLALPNVKVCGGSWLTPADAGGRQGLGLHPTLARQTHTLRARPDEP